MEDQQGVREAIAHVLRRCTFGPDPSQVQDLVGLEAAELARLIVDHAADPSIDAPFDDPVMEVPAFDGEDDEPGQVQEWWLAQMRRPRTGLHERLVWFWHDHFPTSRDKAAVVHLRNHLAMLRREATGNFRTLAKAMVRDGAMLLYLDGAGSQGSDPNENMAREFMELFVVGHGVHTETDVQQAARALSGWYVDWQTGETGFDPDDGYPGVVEVLGQRGRFSADEIVDILCDHPACAIHVASSMHEWLVGTDPDPARIEELASVFREADLDILTLVGAIVGHDSFHTARRSRPKQPLEWLVPAARSLKLDRFETWRLEMLGQAPFAPPTPAGWPHGERWLSPGQVLARLNLLHDGEWEQRFRFDEDDPIPDVLSQCGIFELGEPTLDSLEQAYWAPLDADWANRLLLISTVASPEYALA